MKMKSRVIVYLMAIVLFNIIFFMVGSSNRSISTWISYTFVYISLVVSFTAPLVCINYKRVPENLMTIYGFAWLYMIVSIVGNSVYMINGINNIKLVLISNLVLLALYIAIFLVNYNVNTVVEKQLETVEAEKEFIKKASNNIKICINKVDNPIILKNVEKAYDAVRTSPLHSNEKAFQYEVDILRLTENLIKAVSDNKDETIIKITEDIIDKISARNMLV